MLPIQPRQGITLDEVALGSTLASTLPASAPPATGSHPASEPDAVVPPRLAASPGLIGLLTWLAPVVLLLIWEAAAQLGQFPPHLLPA